MRQSCFFALFTLCLSVGLLGCSHKQKVPKPGKLPSGVDFQGVWYSPQFNHMHLEQNGNRVTGIFYHKAGGRLEGRVSGNLMTFQWVEPGNKDEMRQRLEGKGYFQIKIEAGKPMLVGKWGYGANRTGGGPWRAEFIRELDKTDPLTLEEMER